MKIPKMSDDHQSTTSSARGVQRSPMKRSHHQRRRDQHTDLRHKLRKSTIDREQVNVVKAPKMEMESDPKVLERRSKEIDKGKNTSSYATYREHVNKEDRDRRMPRTPDKYEKIPRRRWDGLVKAWKIQVHRLAEELGSDDIKKEEEMDSAKEEEDEEAWKNENLGMDSWCEEIEKEELENDKLFRSRASSCASSDQGIGLDYSGTATPRTLSGATSPFPTDELELANSPFSLVPTEERELFNSARSRLRKLAK